jgi:hypothetical protein
VNIITSLAVTCCAVLSTVRSSMPHISVGLSKILNSCNEICRCISDGLTVFLEQLICNL